MGHYYFSIFSLIPLGIAYGVLVLIYWGIEYATRGMQARKMILPIVGAVFLVLSIAEELWIAWNFDQACKEAGTFIHKKDQVEGFYDDTTGWGPRQLAESKYRFVESKDILHSTLSRVEKADDASRDRALAWYAEKNPDKQRPNDQFVIQPVSDSQQVAVSPNGIDAWRITKLDRPTARYHFRKTDPMNGTPWAHKVVRSGSVVIDSEFNQEVARYTNFGRQAPWYFFGFYLPGFVCDELRREQFTRNGALIYREALIPVAQ